MSRTEATHRRVGGGELAMVGARGGPKASVDATLSGGGGLLDVWGGWIGEDGAVKGENRWTFLSIVEQEEAVKRACNRQVDQSSQYMPLQLTLSCNRLDRFGGLASL